MRLRDHLDPTLGWRGSSDVEKVRTYTRQSFQFIVVAVAVASMAASAQAGDAISTAAALVCVVSALVVLHRIPALGGASSADVRAPLCVQIAAAAVLVVVGAAPNLLWVAILVTTPIAALVDLRWSLGAAVVAPVVAAASGSTALEITLLAFCIVAMATTVRLSMWLLRIVTELATTRDAAAALSVAEERLRFSRDLHDVVGRALSAIAVKSELAAALARRGDDRAAAQMDEVRVLARESMTDARELVRGYRSVDVAAELRGAQSLLSAAGIRTELTGTVADIPGAVAEQAAWVVREGVTNILRHSRATYCRIEFGDDRLRIVNDRPTSPERAGDGTGLAGLRERLAAVGGSLTVEAGADTFTLAVEFAPTTTSPTKGTS
ncbi:histidine kinase [Rhodococcus sp. MEB041]|uniref:sensor histidine kinase n=1 Tax=Rhodococcus sp. MEB041 TaxID=3040323 RepID=UPI0025516F2E|nr:histidine kinase [Rhodococcus sp. MEB041]